MKNQHTSSEIGRAAGPTNYLVKETYADNWIMIIVLLFLAILGTMGVRDACRQRDIYTREEEVRRREDDEPETDTTTHYVFVPKIE